jgi:hypothetical protein
LQESRYGPVTGYLTTFVEQLHFAGAVMLLYWHYFKRVDLWSMKWDSLEQTPLVSLKADEVDLVKWTVSELSARRRCPGVCHSRVR